MLLIIVWLDIISALAGGAIRSIRFDIEFVIGVRNCIISKTITRTITYLMFSNISFMSDMQKLQTY